MTAGDQSFLTMSATLSIALTIGSSLLIRAAKARAKFADLPNKRAFGARRSSSVRAMGFWTFTTIQLLMCGTIVVSLYCMIQPQAYLVWRDRIMKMDIGSLAVWMVLSRAAADDALLRRLLWNKSRVRLSDKPTNVDGFID